MPYEWSEIDKDGTRVLTAWPHRSLPRRGFAAFILTTWAMMMIPALAVLGTAALWGLLPFLVLAIGLTWILLARSYRGAQLTECLRLSPESTDLTRTEPNGDTRHWRANPHWVQVRLRAQGGPVENYLTLKGGGREVEIGAYLAPEERAVLHGELIAAYAAVRRPA